MSKPGDSSQTPNRPENQTAQERDSGDTHDRDVRNLPTEQAHFFASLIDELPVNVLCKDLEGRVIYANQAVARLLKKQISELIGKTDYDLFPEPLANKYRADDQYVMETASEFRDVEESHAAGSYRSRRDTDSANETRFMEVRKTPLFDKNREVVGVKSVFWDVTLQKRAEATAAHEGDLLHALMNHLPDSIYFKDAGSRFIRVSRSQAVKFGYSSSEDVIGKTDADIFSHEHAQAARRDELEIMRTGKPVLGKVERETWDGSPDTWCSTTKMPLQDAEGQVVGTFGISREVTAQVRAENALRSAKEEADMANRAKGDFLANMSHEIRTPMNAVIGISELLLDTELTKHQREYLTMVLTSGESLLALINDILDFSKIEAGKFELDVQTFDMRDVLGDTVRTLAVRAHNKNLELAFSVSPDLPTRVGGDRNRLRQVLVNLLGNAIKFTSAGEVVLDVALVSTDSRETRVKFSVRDTGIGIAEAQLETVFQEFEQADASTTRQYGGTGLGLAISKRLVELMDGTIEVESVEGDGSTFFFTVTFESVEDEDSDRLLRSSAIEGMEALVLDDNGTNRRILSDILSRWGMRPIAIETPSEAIEVLQKIQSDGGTLPLVISDFAMPEMDGLDFVQAIRNQPAIASATVILLSSAMRSDSNDRCDELGIAARVMKPVKQAEMFDAILTATGTEHDVVEDRSREKISPPAKDLSGKSLDILLAEDNLVNQKLAQGVLKSNGHTATVANNGREAVDMWQAGEYDVILMDVQMPEMDGFQATQEIRRLEAADDRLGHITIIAMTARAKASDREECLASGMDEYLSKPIRIAELAELLRTVSSVEWQPTGNASDELASSETNTEEATPMIDWQVAAQAVNDDVELLKEVVKVLLESGPGMLQEVRDAIAEKDSGKLRLKAHALKGSVLFLGIDVVRMPALELEMLGEAGELPTNNQLLERLESDWAGVKDEITSFVDC